MAEPVLQNDGELIKLTREKMRFEDDPFLRTAQTKFDWIRIFLDCYNNTDQDTVLFAPEFKIVVANIIAGRRPVKLHFLTDFPGELK